MGRFIFRRFEITPGTKLQEFSLAGLRRAKNYFAAE
jgi:hypothetical protein